MYALTSNTSNCKNCYKCIRYCPVKAISFENDKASIIHLDCILCGTCYHICPQNLKKIRSDTDTVRQLIASGAPVIASVAPSFAAYYEHCDAGTMTRTLQKLGFQGCEETAVGATIVKKAYDDMLEEDHDVILSTCCHSANTLIKRYYPDLLPMLAPVLSPMLAHGKDIKSRIPGARTVFIGPCIAKKDEADQHPDLIDAALTFEELDAWLEEEQIEMEKTESPERIEKSKARLFPTRGGVLRTMDCASDRYEYLAVDGVENIMRMAEDIRAGRIHHCFIEMSACEGSCVNGPVSVKKNQSIAGGTIAVNQFAGKRDFDCYHVQPDEIGCAYEDDHRHRVMPSEELIQKTLVKMHKEDPASRLNCGSCGYDSCREKAVAIIRGRANPDMCLPLMMEKAASMSDKIVSNSTNGLMVLDDNLHIQLINDRMCRMLGGLKSAELIGQQVTAILDPFDYLDALNGEHVRARKQHLEQYGKWVENTVIYDQKFNVLICIMRDITKQEEDSLKQKKLVEQTLMVADEVLNNNMMTVHEIASLLGETAAQTKVALTTLKETIKND